MNKKEFKKQLNKLKVKKNNIIKYFSSTEFENLCKNVMSININFLTLFAQGLTVMLVLTLLNYNISLMLYVQSLALVLAIEELPDFIKRCRR